VDDAPGLDRVMVKQVLRYFVCHPQATDDLEGVARWRLAAETIRTTIGDTQRALTWLVERNYLQRTRTVGSATLFSLNPDKIAEASALLAGEDVQTAPPSPERRLPSEALPKEG
jgi:hypothetical protein